MIAQAAPTATSLPVEVTAMGLLALVVYYFVRKAQRDEERRDREAQDDAKRAKESARQASSAMEKLASCREEIAEQRRQKHDAINRYAAAQGQVILARQFAEGCTCDARDPLMRILSNPIGGGEAR